MFEIECRKSLDQLFQKFLHKLHTHEAMQAALEEGDMSVELSRWADVLINSS